MRRRFLLVHNPIAGVAGLRIPVMDTPIAQMADRHEYPNPPASSAPLATVK